MTQSNQLYFFIGDNHFEVKDERRRWVSNFTEKHGEQNLLTLDGSKIKLQELLDEVAAAPFLAEKRLIVIDGAVKWKKDDVALLLRTIHPSVLLLVVVCLDPSKKGATPAGLKAYEPHATLKKFPRRSRVKLLEWMQGYMQSLGSTIQMCECEQLLACQGDDQMMLATELQKLSSYAPGREVTLEDIEQLCMVRSDHEVWELFSLLSKKKGREAVLFVRDLVARGESAHSVWSRLLWMLSQLALVKATLDEGTTNPQEISKITGVNFYSCRTLVPCARSLDWSTVRQLVARAAQADVDLKTGKLKATAESSQELEATIDECLLAFV